MPILIAYLLKLSIGVTVLYLFYQLVLRRLTFYNWNRWYFLTYTMLVFLIPFIDVSHALNTSVSNTTGIIKFVPILADYTNVKTSAPTSDSNFGLDLWNAVNLIFYGGIMFLLVRLLIQYVSYRRLRNSSQRILEGPIKIFQVNKRIIPFSFGDSIFINQQLHNCDELGEIIRHEFVHVRQKHTIDIIWGELFCAFNWYNPFAWMIRKALRQNLEFIADEQVLQGGIDKKQYQYLLLKVIGSSEFRIASQFNFSSLKKRIAMMNRIKSAKINLFRFLFVLPLLAVLTIAFRSKQNLSIQNTPEKHDLKTAINNINPSATIKTRPFHSSNQLVIADTKKGIAQKRVLTKAVQDTVPDSFDEVNAFIKRNPSVKSVFWKSKPARICIEFRDGKQEIYKLDDKEEIASAESKYGKLPIAPPAPPSRSFSLQMNVLNDNESLEIKADSVILFEDKKIFEFKGEVVILQNNNRIKLKSNSIKIDLVNNILICDTIEIKTDTLSKKTEEFQNK